MTIETQLKAIHAGSVMPLANLARLERKLAANPDQLLDRLNLVGMLFLNKEPEMRRRHYQNIFWLIQNYPALEAWQDRFMNPHKIPDDMANDGVLLWSEQIKQSCDDILVLRNAGRWVISLNFDLGRMFLLAALRLSPTDTKTCQLINRASFEQMQTAHESTRLELARLSLDTGETFLKYTDSSYTPEFNRCLEMCAKSAFVLGDFESAKHHAERHVLLTKDWDNIPHWSQAMLGLVDLNSEAFNTAEARLLSLEQNSIVDETDIELLNSLVARGHLNAPRDYLLKCRDLGKWSGKLLESWLSLVSKRQRIVV